METGSVLFLKRVALLFLVAAVLDTDAYAQGSGINILCTTFPVYQITRNVTQGREPVTVGLMLPSRVGCPHDYVLTPRDMQKIAKARVLVINGLGLEEFMGAPVRQANPKIKILDSSAGITRTIRYAGKEEHGHKGQHGAVEGHHHDGINPHLFASPRMTALIAVNIAEGLSRFDPAGADIYRGNAREYGAR
ncbi:zinc ABC transporter substrate-binding protein, partial [archaeon]|nr:zinc ABC transporter substrate-binding protein [archaeon]